jgi:hypothetical protein
MINGQGIQAAIITIVGNGIYFWENDPGMGRGMREKIFKNILREQGKLPRHMPW